jgi:hypothetical protein
VPCSNGSRLEGLTRLPWKTSRSEDRLAGKIAGPTTLGMAIYTGRLDLETLARLATNAHE